jgi:hypothetical protein
MIGSVACAIFTGDAVAGGSDAAPRPAIASNPMNDFTFDLLPAEGFADIATSRARVANVFELQ